MSKPSTRPAAQTHPAARHVALLALPVLLSSAPIPVIFDTDIGTDIDDAYALAQNIGSPELKIVGVTT